MEIGERRIYQALPGPRQLLDPPPAAAPPASANDGVNATQRHPSAQITTPNFPASSKNVPPVLDTTVSRNFSPDVLMTAAIDGQIFLWDRRVSSKSMNVARLSMSERAGPWCVSVSNLTLVLPID